MLVLRLGFPFAEIMSWIGFAACCGQVDGSRDRHDVATLSGVRLLVPRVVGYALVGPLYHLAVPAGIQYDYDEYSTCSRLRSCWFAVPVHIMIMMSVPRAVGYGLVGPLYRLAVPVHIIIMMSILRVVGYGLVGSQYRPAVPVHIMIMMSVRRTIPFRCTCTHYNYEEYSACSRL